MKVLFLEIDTEKTWAMASMGPALLAPHMAQHGHGVDFMRISVDTPIHRVPELIHSRNPGVVALSLTNRQWVRAKEIMNAVKLKIKLPVVAGGLMPTFCSTELLAEPGFDFACIGQGEAALPDLVNVLARNKVPGNGEIANIRTKSGAFPRLSSPLAPGIPVLPPDRRLLDEPQGIVHLNAARGCPFSCAYCGARSLQNLYGEKTPEIRREPDDVIAELSQLITKRPINYVIFLDDTFTADKRWVELICRKFKQKVGAGFTIHARPDTVNERILAILHDSGCKHIVYGVESGSKRVRKEIMNRPMSDATIKQAFARTRKQGMLATANYMLGLPGETKEDVEKTLKLHQQLDPDDFGFFVYYPYPGTPLFELCRDKGYLPENYLDLPVTHNKSILRLPDLSQSDIFKYYRLFKQEKSRVRRGRNRN